MFNYLFKTFKFFYIYVFMFGIIFLFNSLYFQNLYFFNILVKQKYFCIQIDYFSTAIIFLSLIISIISILLTKTKFYKNYYFFIFYILFNFFIIFLTISNNYFVFFILYELLLLISVYLVFISSPNLRSKNISFYFLLWTQLGSFIIFILTLLLFSKSQNCNFSTIQYLNFSKNELYIIKFLLFFGFGIKIPIWPFHFWLTKTHVEANTSFSIFLSGILVKTALTGLYKYYYFFNFYSNFIFIFIIFISLIDSTIKIFSLMDIKKIVAYCTVFEMNLIMFCLFFLNKNNFLFIILFSYLHSILSGLFFFIVDCIYKRFNSRIINSINNISNYYPMLSFFIIISVLFFNGLPLTLKFILELNLILKLISYNFLYLILFFFIQIYFIIFFTKNFFSVLFSFKRIKTFNDLSKKEILLFLFFLLNIIIMSIL